MISSSSSSNIAKSEQLSNSNVTNSTKTADASGEESDNQLDMPADDNEDDSSFLEPESIQSPSSGQLSRVQSRFIIILLVVCNFFIANGVSLQGPFFPKEAEKKGATPLIYSAIFAIYELVMLVTSFFFGALVEKFKPNRMSGLGLTLTGLSTTMFGCLSYIHIEWMFVSAAFFLRISESLSATAFATSSYSFISVCFPDQTATMFAMMEMFFGLGVITGPVIGSLLYNFDGFLLPFLTAGVAMMVCGIVMITKPVERLFAVGKSLQLSITTPTLPITNQQQDDQYNSNDNSNNEDSFITLIVPNNYSTNDPNQSVSDQNFTLKRFLSSTIIVTDSFIIVTAIMLMGFLGATLEPFVRHSNITDNTLIVSLMFVALGASYALSALIWGKISDRFSQYLLCFAMMGSLITAVGLLFLAPITFLGNVLQPSVQSICGCMVLFGIGVASKQVTAYTHAQNYTIKKRKFPANQKTYGYVSAMFFSCLSLGGFLGPIIGGILVEWSTFQKSTLVMFIIETVVFIILCFLKIFVQRE